MQRLSILLLIALMGIFGLVGCGGAGVNPVLPDNPDSGIYSAAFNRAGGKISITLAKNSTVTVTIVDEAAGTFIGNGSVRSNESFSVNCVGPNGASIIVDGSLNKSALSKNYIGKARGSMTFSYNAPLALGNVTVSLFSGEYTGNVDMRNVDSYPATAVIDSNGFVTVDFSANGTPVTLKGLVYSDGHILLNPADGQTLKYWGKGTAYMFADLQNLYFKCSISTKKDGKEVGVIRLQTQYYPG